MADTSTNGEQVEDTQEGRRRRDPELRAIERIVQELDELSPDAAKRALSYLRQRYNGTIDGLLVEESLVRR